MEKTKSLNSPVLNALCVSATLVSLLCLAPAAPAKDLAQTAPVLVEVRHEPAAEGQTSFTLEAKTPLTLNLKELEFNEKTSTVNPARITFSRRLGTGETYSFSHLVPEGIPNLTVCATAESGTEMNRELCWIPFFSGEDGRLLMDAGFRLKQ